jgi:hypothetical protein
MGMVELAVRVREPERLKPRASQSMQVRKRPNMLRINLRDACIDLGG